jgi:hypothetical protein
MKFRYTKATGLAIAAGLLLGTPSALATENTSPSPKPTLSAEQKALRDQFKAAIANYKAAKIAAHTAFKSAVAAAKAARDAGVAAATTPEAKAAAKSAFKDAIAKAKSTRDAALAQLGAKPVAPTKPAA